MWNRIFKNMDVMQRSLSASWERNAIIRNNIANIETPNFKATELHFESLLASAIANNRGFVAATTHPMHRDFRAVDLNAITPRVTQQRGLSMRADGNNVDIESENVRMAQNSIFYNTVMEKLNGEIRRLRMAISEGR